MHRTLIPAALAVAAILTGSLACDRAPPELQAEVTPVALPDNLLLTTAPVDAKGVADVRKSAAEGDRVVMRGVVAGRAEPIADNRALFVLLDESIRTCDLNPGDDCETPWDACCEPQDVIAANAATVQVVDAEGRPLRTGLAGVGNLKPLSHVTVVGTYQPSADGKAAAVNATGFYVSN